MRPNALAGVRRGLSFGRIFASNYSSPQSQAHYSSAAATSSICDLNSEVEVGDEVLGEGKFGVVRRGMYQGEEVAVKTILNKNRGGGDEIRFVAPTLSQ